MFCQQRMHEAVLQDISFDTDSGDYYWLDKSCQIAAIALLNLIPIILKLFYEDLFGDFSDYDLSYYERYSKS